MSRLRDMRKRNQHAAAWAPICPECGQRGRHYVPASLGEPGFYACEAFRGASSQPSRIDDALPADRASHTDAHSLPDDGGRP